MPEFNVVAGPNGAGKSAFSRTLSLPDALIFDPDEEKRKIWAKFPDISDDAVEAQLTRVYHQFEHDALENNLNFTVETNLRSDFLSRRVVYFEEKRFQVNLIFILLRDVIESMERVNMRVARKGHFVDADSIKVNFDEGLKNAIELTGSFDKIMVFDGSSSERLVQTPVLLALFKPDKQPYINYDTPKWAAKFLAALGYSYIDTHPAAESHITVKVQNLVKLRYRFSKDRRRRYIQLTIAQILNK